MMMGGRKFREGSVETEREARGAKVVIIWPWYPRSIGKKGENRVHPSLSRREDEQTTGYPSCTKRKPPKRTGQAVRKKGKNNI